MTPESALGGLPTGNASSPLYNSLSSAGDLPAQQASESPSPEESKENPIERFMARFQNVMNIYEDVAQNYPGAEDSMREVLEALAKWATEVSGKLNTGEAPARMA